MRCVQALLVLLVYLSIAGCGSGIAPAGDHVLTDNVVFLGDSITFLWAESPEFETHANWIDKGVSGESSNQIANRFLGDVIALQPKTVHILAGTNDVSPGWQLCASTAQTATIFSPPGPEALSSVPDTCANMRYMVETAKRAGIRVVIGTIPPWGCSDNPVCGLSIADESGSRYDRIAALNAWLVTFAKEEGIAIIDYHAMLADQTNLHYAAGLTLDGVHPSPAGYARMTPALLAAFQ